MIESFTGPYRWLSNFWSCRIVIDGEVYSSVEAAYQASKTQRREERDHIRMLPTAGLAKKAGRRVTLREDWEDIKLTIMADLIMQKFSKDPVLKEKLLATGDEEIVEGNDWGDREWGVYLGTGKNHLGKIIMQVRQRLRAKPR